MNKAVVEAVIRLVVAMPVVVPVPVVPVEAVELAVQGGWNHQTVEPAAGAVVEVAGEQALLTMPVGLIKN
jgi:hypothetical protein